MRFCNVFEAFTLGEILKSATARFSRKTRILPIDTDLSFPVYVITVFR